MFREYKPIQDIGLYYLHQGSRFFVSTLVQNGQIHKNEFSITNYLYSYKISFTFFKNIFPVAAAGGMAGECLSLSAPGCVMCGNFAPMRALLSALRRGEIRRGAVAALPPPTGRRREKCSNTCGRFPSTEPRNAIFARLCAAFPTTDQEVKPGLSLGIKSEAR